MPEVEERIYKDISKLSPLLREIVFRDIIRTASLVRVAQLELVTAGRSESISDHVKQMMQKPLTELRGYDQKIRALFKNVPDSEMPWLSTELAKEKMYDIGNFVELAMRVNSEEFNELMGLHSTFLEHLIKIQKLKPSVNIKKYRALLKFLEMELSAEINGKPCIFFDEETNAISFKLQDPQVNIA